MDQGKHEMDKHRYEAPSDQRGVWAGVCFVLVLLASMFFAGGSSRVQAGLSDRSRAGGQEEAAAVPTEPIRRWPIPTAAPTVTPQAPASLATTTSVLASGGSAGRDRLPESGTSRAEISPELLKTLIRIRVRMLLMRTETPLPEPSRLMLPLIYNSSATQSAPSPTETSTSDATPSPMPDVVPDSSAPLPAPTPDGVVRIARVPILMYHYLSAPPEDADIYRRDLSVTPEHFARHLDRIQIEGYTTISLTDLLLHLTRGAPLPPKPVVITFDDGYRDNYVNAFPLLRDRGMTATFFIVTDFVDEERPEYVTWDMVREMYRAGMSIESHGRNHASLSDRDDAYLVWQALGSRETIEYELGVRPRIVSYPAGQYDENTLRIFQSAGYWAGLTTQQGANHRSDELFELQRIRIRGTTEVDDLAHLLSVDW